MIRLTQIFLYMPLEERRGSIETLQVLTEQNLSNYVYTTSRNIADARNRE